MCAQCIKRGKQATCTYEIPEDELDDEYYASLPAPPKPRAPKQPKLVRSTRLQGYSLLIIDITHTECRRSLLRP